MWSKLKIYSVSIGIAIVVLIVASIVIVVFKPDKEVKKSDDFGDNSNEPNGSLYYRKGQKKLQKSKQQNIENQNQNSNASGKVSQFELEFDDKDENKQVSNEGKIQYEVDGEVQTTGPVSNYFQFPFNNGPNNWPNMGPMITQMESIRPIVWNNNKEMKYTTLTEEEVKNELNKMFGGVIDDDDGGGNSGPNSGADADADSDANANTNAGANDDANAGANADTNARANAGASNQVLNSECLSAQNIKRRKHGVSDLVLDNALMEIAKKRAIELKNDNKLETKPDMRYGENLHYVSRRQTYKCSKVVKVWYKEIKNYNFDDPTKSTGVVGHFTQLIWKSSQKVGCAQAFNDNIKKLYTVCIYYPPGNYKGQQKNNVPNIRSDNRPDNKPVNRPNNVPNNRPFNRPNQINRPMVGPMVTQITSIGPIVWNNNKKYTTLSQEEVKNELNKMFGGIIGR